MSAPACPVCGTTLPAPVIAAPDRLHGTPGRFAVAVCPGCDAGVTLPLVDAPALAAFYPEDYAPYAARGNPLAAAISRAIQAWQGRRARRRPPFGAVAARAPGRGVDVGCGRGDLAVMLAARGWRMTGVEPSAGACAAARARGIDARNGVLSTVALEPGAYDAALFQQSLEHTDDPVGDLRRVHAALAAGGVVAISVPNFGGWQSRRFRGRWYHLDLPRHRVHFTPAGVRALLAANGFEPLTTTHLLLEHNPFGMWQSAVNRVTSRPSYLYNVLKRNAPVRSRDLAVTLAALPLVPVAVVAELAAGLCRRGGTVAFVARRSSR
jgi:SAM-dependent methyltransferase